MMRHVEAVYAAANRVGLTVGDLDNLCDLTAGFYPTSFTPQEAAAFVRVLLAVGDFQGIVQERDLEREAEAEGDRFSA